MHRCDNQILPSVKDICQQREHNTNSTVERVHSPKTITLCDASALVTPSQGAMKVITDSGANDLLRPYRGSLKVSTHRGASQVIMMLLTVLKKELKNVKNWWRNRVSRPSPSSELLQRKGNRKFNIELCPDANQPYDIYDHVGFAPTSYTMNNQDTRVENLDTNLNGTPDTSPKVNGYAVPIVIQP